jgi:transcription elongation factor
MGLGIGLLALAGVAGAQAPHASGTVKTISDTGLTLTTASGDVTVAVPAAAKILLVDPKTMDTKAAAAGTLSDVTTGDKAIVTGTAGDTPTALTATKVYLLKAAAIASVHAADEAAWAHGGGGIVKSVNLGAGTIVLSSGMKMITVQTAPATIVRVRYGFRMRLRARSARSSRAISFVCAGRNRLTARASRRTRL